MDELPAHLGKSDHDLETLVAQENLEKTKQMINDDPSFLTKDLNEVRYRLLDRAAEAGNFPLVKFIVEKNPETVNYMSPNTGADALLCSLRSGHQDLSDYLIEHGAAFSKKYNNNQTHAIYPVLNGGNYKMAKYYMERYKIPPTEPAWMDGRPIWCIPMLDYTSLDKPEVKKQRIDFFRYCTSQMKPGDCPKVADFNWLSRACNYDHDHNFFDELVRLEADLLIVGEPDWKSNHMTMAMIVGDEYIVKCLLKNYGSIPTFHPEYMKNKSCHLIMDEYGRLSYKWERLMDIYTIRILSEFVQGTTQEIDPMMVEDEGIKKAYTEISTQTKKSAIFRVNRRIFSNIMTLLPVYPVEVPKFN